jgi:hypothetical protein
VLVDRGCKHRRCTVNVAVTDTPPSSGALGVTGRLTGATRCKRHHVCKRPRPKTLIGKRTAAERFTIATGRLKPGRYALALRASDAAGNVQAIATTVRLSVR